MSGGSLILVFRRREPFFKSRESLFLCQEWSLFWVSMRNFLLGLMRKNFVWPVGSLFFVLGREPFGSNGEGEFFGRQGSLFLLCQEGAFFCYTSKKYIVLQLEPSNFYERKRLFFPIEPLSIWVGRSLPSPPLSSISSL